MVNKYERRIRFIEAGKYIDEHFIRTFRELYFGIKEYTTKDGKIVYYDWDEDELDYEECICIMWVDTPHILISICEDRMETKYERKYTDDEYEEYIKQLICYK
jgi:hypothetical protein